MTLLARLAGGIGTDSANHALEEGQKPHNNDDLVAEANRMPALERAPASQDSLDDSRGGKTKRWPSATDDGREKRVLTGRQRRLTRNLIGLFIATMNKAEDKRRTTPARRGWP